MPCSQHTERNNLLLVDVQLATPRLVPRTTAWNASTTTTPARALSTSSLSVTNSKHVLSRGCTSSNRPVRPRAPSLPFPHHRHTHCHPNSRHAISVQPQLRLRIRDLKKLKRLSARMKALSQLTIHGPGYMRNARRTAQCPLPDRQTIGWRDGVESGFHYGCFLRSERDVRRILRGGYAL